MNRPGVMHPLRKKLPVTCLAVSFAVKDISGGG